MKYFSVDQLIYLSPFPFSYLKSTHLVSPPTPQMWLKTFQDVPSYSYTNSGQASHIPCLTLVPTINISLEASLQIQLQHCLTTAGLTQMVVVRAPIPPPPAAGKGGRISLTLPPPPLLSLTYITGFT